MRLQEDILRRQESLLRQVATLCRLRRASEVDLNGAKDSARARNDARLEALRLQNVMGY